MADLGAVARAGLARLPTPLRRRQCALFVCGSMTAAAYKALDQLVRQAPRWLDVFLVGFDPDGRPADPVTVAGRALPYLMYAHRDLVELGLPARTGAAADFSLVPHHVDLIYLRFVRDHPGYARYWWVEDDVRFGGDWATVFTHFRRHRAGLIGTSVRRQIDDPDWVFWPGVGVPAAAARGGEPERLAAFIPFGCATPDAVAAVDRAYRQGWTGHFEALWPMAVAHAGLPIGDFGGAGRFVDPDDVNRFYTSVPVGHLNPGTFCYRPYHRDYDRVGGMLWHPIRDRRRPASRPPEDARGGIVAADPAG